MIGYRLKGTGNYTKLDAVDKQLALARGWTSLGLDMFGEDSSGSTSNDMGFWVGDMMVRCHACVNS